MIIIWGNMRYIVLLIVEGMIMAQKKTATLNLRIDPGLKEALRIAANLEHRSIANMVGLLIRKHCEETGISIHEQQALFEDNKGE
jgi:uncharacterized protein (DUF1778 family)